MPAINTGRVQGYDLIGDVHGCGNSLMRLLEKMGYEYRNGCYRHPTRKVIFLGDIVDRGPRIREALHVVKDMIDQGQAQMVLGNHEYNALCYCTESRDDEHDSYLRAHTARNHRLIKETLEQFDDYRGEWSAFLHWFQEIPLFLELEHFRVVHACWDAQTIARFSAQCPDHTLNDDYLHASALEGTQEHLTVDRLTRGTQLSLPDGEQMLSRDGTVRTAFRTKFWSSNPSTYQDVVFQPDPLPDHLVNLRLSRAEREALIFYSEQEKPVFVGHYWMSGEPRPIARNVAVLDYSAVKYGKLVAYRMDDESVLDPAKYVCVDVVSTS